MNYNISVEEAMGCLNMDPRRNLSLIFLLGGHRGNVLSIDRMGDAILVRFEHHSEWMFISSKDEHELRGVLPLLGDRDLRFACIEAWMAPIVRRDFSIDVQHDVWRYVLPNDVHIAAPDVEVKNLSVSDAAAVDEGWEFKEKNSFQYIENQIETDFSAGIREDGRLAACAVMHDVGSIGFLHTIEECRRRGLGSQIVRYLSLKLREAGRLPHTFIITDNVASQKLFESIGFVRDGTYAWLDLKPRR